MALKNPDPNLRQTQQCGGFRCWLGFKR